MHLSQEITFITFQHLHNRSSTAYMAYPHASLSGDHLHHFPASAQSVKHCIYGLPSCISLRRSPSSLSSICTIGQALHIWLTLMHLSQEITFITFQHLHNRSSTAYM